MTVFLASLAGIPPLGGWYAKFSVFTSLTSAGTNWGYGLAVVAAINAVIAFGYYGKIAMRMWVEDPHEALEGEVKVPVSLLAALVLTAGTTIAFGVAPGIVTHFTDVSLIFVDSRFSCILACSDGVKAVDYRFGALAANLRDFLQNNFEILASVLG